MSDKVGFREEIEQVRLAARARNESEYDIFVAAWAAWHGSEPSPGQVDADFGTYLREEAVPPYVRHFVRRWLAANPELLRNHIADYRALRRARFLALALIILAVIIALLVRQQL